ncbi:cell division protein FtsQ/DivIB [Thiobacter aerophilum]|uniref:Cell division protein FtsQ n=1 Tax=Thiobacter aerophilum TaxID=3121275 RepID=A0ABV0EFN4_9BURK
MWRKHIDKGDLQRRPMAAPGSNFLVLSQWDRAQLMLWLANLLYALAAILLVYALLFLVIHLPVFPLRHVEVKGELRHVTYQQVSYIVTREFKGNFFTLDLARITQAFEKLPWVRHASLRRQWPDRLEVTLEEHVALARWAAGGLVNTRGEVFQAASDEPLPLFDGPEGAAREMVQHYEVFRSALAPAGLKPVAVHLNARRAWELKLDNGLLVALGREQVAARLSRFARHYAATVGQLSQAVAYVDLRYPNGFAVRLGAPAGKV